MKNRKRTLIVLAMIVCAVTLICLSACTGEGPEPADMQQTTDGFVLLYDVETQSYTVTDYVGADIDVCIPSEYDDGTNGQYAVTSIGEHAFYNRSEITSITVPDSIVRIADYAFLGCSGLTSVYIGDLSAWCGIRFGSISNPLNYANNLYLNGTKVTDLVIPNDVAEIAPHAFEACTGLKSVNISDSVEYIGYDAFYGCSDLAIVTIGSGVEHIGSTAFYNCYKLTTVNFNAKECSSAGSYSAPIFSECSNLTTINIGYGVTSIPAYAFHNCSNLATVIIPDSVKSIGNNAFDGCTGLTSITIGNRVNSIGKGAFFGCYHLVEVYNKSVLVITTGSEDNGYVGYCAKEVHTEEYASKLSTDEDGYIIYTDGMDKILVGYIGKEAELTLPTGITKINRYAFYGNTNISSVNIGKDLYEIGSGAFYNCTGLTSVAIGSDVKNVGTSAFYNCSNLTTVNIGAKVIKIPAYAFYNCTSLTSITIPDNVTNIGDSAFYNCSGLTTVNWNASSCELAGSSSNTIFFGCSNLTTVNIGAKVIKIPAYAFYNCTSLTSITIPDNVTNIGDSAFYNCSGLTSVNITDLTAWCGIEFKNYASNPLCCAKNLYINGERPSGNFVIPNGVKEVPAYTFYGCFGLTSVTIPDSVEYIGCNAFNNCKNLTSIIFEDASTWYYTSSYDNWKKKKSGKEIKVTDNSKHYDCYWYKK